MRHVTAATLSAILAVCLSSGSVRAADTPEHQYPLGHSKLSLAGGAKPGSRRITFTAQWSGTMSPMPNPAFPGTTLRVIGGPRGGGRGGGHPRPTNWNRPPNGKGDPDTE